ncbi:hypothetical protein M9Y10_035920 [Tritrichomonas musculus]|uniref:Uncharacterized protein n=1 Tax=Tritrichomonas musculus TaxID=1915356 RepID=A0ABR2GWD7_9EUKA
MSLNFKPELYQQNRQNTKNAFKNLDVQQYVDEKVKLYEALLEFLENPDDNNDDFQNLITTIYQQQYEKEPEKLEHFFQLLISIANNHQSGKLFYKKIMQIIEYYEDQIKKNFTNIKIFDIFKSNKILLLFLLENGVITIDEIIKNEIMTKIESNGNKFCLFFYPEIKEIVGNENDQIIKNELLNIDRKIFEYYEQKRHDGENDSYICNLIRHDLVDEFVSYVNQSNYSINSEVKSSIFETNSFLIENQNTTLIEYATFFGSIQIFHFLRMSGAKLTERLWLYAIHSNNAEMIHLLESYKLVFQEEKGGNIEKYYEKYLIESIKCHHNNIANYIENTFLPRNKIKNFYANTLKYYNYQYFPTEFDEGNDFCHLCSHNYQELVKILLNKYDNSTNNLLLKEAVYKNNVEIIYYLLQDKKEIDSKCFNGNKNLKAIALPFSIACIGIRSFTNCHNLSQVIISSSVKSICNHAFENCLSLKQITIPSSVTSIGKYAFHECNSLRQIKIPSSVTSIGNHAFSKCSQLENVELFGFIKTIEKYVFKECSSLKQIEIPISVTKIDEYAFYQCLSLNHINIPISVRTIGECAFNGCLSLKQIIIPSTISFGSYVFPSSTTVLGI